MILPYPCHWLNVFCLTLAGFEQFFLNPCVLLKGLRFIRSIVPQELVSIKTYPFGMIKQIHRIERSRFARNHTNRPKSYKFE